MGVPDSAAMGDLGGRKTREGSGGVRAPIIGDELALALLSWARYEAVVAWRVGDLWMEKSRMSGVHTYFRLGVSAIIIIK